MVRIDPQFTIKLGKDFEILECPKFSQTDGLFHQRTLFESHERSIRKSVRQMFTGRRDGLKLRVLTGSRVYEAFDNRHADSYVFGISQGDASQDIFWRNRVDRLSRSSFTVESDFKEWFDERDDGKRFQCIHLGLRPTDFQVGEFYADNLEIWTRVGSCEFDLRILYDVLAKTTRVNKISTSESYTPSKKDSQAVESLIGDALRDVTQHYIEFQTELNRRESEERDILSGDRRALGLSIHEEARKIAGRPMLPANEYQKYRQQEQNSCAPLHASTH